MRVSELQHHGINLSELYSCSISHNLHHGGTYVVPFTPNILKSREHFSLCQRLWWGNVLLNVTVFSFFLIIFKVSGFLSTTPQPHISVRLPAPWVQALCTEVESRWIVTHMTTQSWAEMSVLAPGHGTGLFYWPVVKWDLGSHVSAGNLPAFTLPPQLAVE